MRNATIAATVSLALLGAACAREGGRTETRTTTTRNAPDGRSQEKTTIETTRVGSTVEQKETRTLPAAGKSGKSERDVIETWVGTVTAYEPGKRIEVMTGDKKTHAVSLDDKKTRVDVHGRVAVGDRVTLVDEKTPEGRRVSVRTGG